MTVAVAFFVESATLVAVTEAVFEALTAGGVYNPPFVMVPAEVDHVSAVLVVPVTAAVNCCVVPEYKVTLFGEIVTDTRSLAPYPGPEVKISTKANPTDAIDSFSMPPRIAPP